MYHHSSLFRPTLCNKIIFYLVTSSQRCKQVKAVTYERSKIMTVVGDTGKKNVLEKFSFYNHNLFKTLKQDLELFIRSHDFQYNNTEQNDVQHYQI